MREKVVSENEYAESPIVWLFVYIAFRRVKCSISSMKIASWRFASLLLASARGFRFGVGLDRSVLARFCACVERVRLCCKTFLSTTGSASRTELLPNLRELQTSKCHVADCSSMSFMSTLNMIQQPIHNGTSHNGATGGRRGVARD